MGTYLDRTPSSAGNRRTFTISFWTKITGGFGSSSRWIFGAGTQSSDNDYLLFPSGDTLKFSFATEASGNIATSKVFRDPSAWYHVVVAVDTTQATAADRVKMYVNGDQITSFGTASYPAQNYETSINNTVTNRIGARAYSATGYYNGYFSQFILVDGTALTPSSFGSTNANGIWVPNTSPSVTYGTNGFKLDFTGTGTSADSSGFGADSSGNNNHFASNNLGTNPNTKDGPENNFCTLNPLNKTASINLSLGNLKGTNTANDQGAAGTMGFSAGKWYWEVKLINQAEVGVNLDSDILILTQDATIGSNDSNIKQTALVTNNAGGANDFRFNGSTETVNSTSCSNGDILMVAVDADNTKIYFGKNGTWMNSGDPAAGTGELKNFSSGYTAGNFITPTYTMGVSTTAKCEFNFGQPPFTISSSNSDANGEGTFEYAVPSGYYALCTNNLALYGG